MARGRIPVLLAVLLILIIAGECPSRALAAGPSSGDVYVPPGLSSASQYTEVVPSAGGNEATASLLGHGGSSESSLTAGTTAAMSRSATGRSAAAFARASAGDTPGHRSPVEVTSSGGSDLPGQIAAAAVTNGAGGLGVALPVLIIAFAILLSALGLVQRRRSQ